MMSFDRIARYVGAEPFRPFRIKMVSGEHYDIRHPEMIHVGRRTAIVYMWLTDSQDEEPTSREQEIAIMLIEAIEHLDAPAKQEN